MARYVLWYTWTEGGVRPPHLYIYIIHKIYTLLDLAPPKQNFWVRQCIGTHPREEVSSNLQYPQQQTRLDPVSRRHLQQDLINGVGDSKFNGSPEEYWSWYYQINSKIMEAELSPLDTLFALKANTTGKPRKMICDFLTAALSNPARVLSEVWATLRKRFGSNALISKHLEDRLSSSKPITSPSQTEEIHNLLGLLRVIKANIPNCPNLKYIELQKGMEEIWQKLPSDFQSRYQKQFTMYELHNGVPPPLDHLLQSIENYAEEKSNPAFKRSGGIKAKVYLTETRNKPENKSSATFCGYHQSSAHSIHKCREFRELPYPDRRQAAIDGRMCFNCLGPHRANQCPRTIKCTTCSKHHSVLMHRDFEISSNRGANNQDYRNDAHWTGRKRDEYQKTGWKKNEDHRTGWRKSEDQRTGWKKNEDQKTRDKKNEEDDQEGKKSYCTAVCESRSAKKTCSKTLPVELISNDYDQPLRCLAIIDEQSSDSFIDEKVLQHLNVPEINLKPNTYTLSTLSQISSQVNGSAVTGLRVRGINSNEWIRLPSTLTHPSIPDTRNEVATPSIVRAHRHVSHLAKNFPSVNSDLEVLILIGNNCGDAMKTQCFGSTYPYAHRTALGWALVGPCCLDDTKSTYHKVSVLRTSSNSHCEHYSTKSKVAIPKQVYANKKCEDVFIERSDDELPGPSREDKQFNLIISSNIDQNKIGNLETPLPFKTDASLPDNKYAVLHRSTNTLNRISRDKEKTEKCRTTMQGYIDKGHVVQLTNDDIKKEGAYYLNVFPVSTENKPKIRLVFDSAAKFQGKSLNDNLLQGPDESNRIVGVLTRFRHHEVGYSADIECMFHSFFVTPEHRHFMRFFWWKDNDPSKSIVAYQANVHVFGNKCSPAIATYALRHTTLLSNIDESSDVHEFIHHNVYVDDGLRSETSVEKAISTLTEARNMLSKFNIRLHKIVATDPAVLQAFPPSEIATDVDTLELHLSSEQHALGITWKISDDVFHLGCKIRQRGFTKRIVLSINGSLFDPLGMASPVSLMGRLLQRQFFPPKSSSENYETYDWDDPLPEKFRPAWDEWLSQLEDSRLITIPRCFHPKGFGPIVKAEVHVFADASSNAIGHVIYLRQFNDQGHISVAFVSGSSKVSPRSATSIPRLELCAATDAAKSAVNIVLELRTAVDQVFFYSDSNVTLGYISNKEARFSRYVTSRVESILHSSKSEQWHYINTSENPADIATKAHTPKQLINTPWFSGPQFLQQGSYLLPRREKVPLPEVVEEVTVLQSSKQNNTVFSYIVNKSESLVRTIHVTALVFLFISKIKKSSITEEEARSKAILFLVRKTQQDYFSDLYHDLSNSRPSKYLESLCPFLDTNNIIRVGGRLRHSDIAYDEKHPILLPPNHPLTIMILRNHHQRTHHQGRHVTVAAVKQAGFHILNQRQVIGSFLKSCIVCQKLRGKFQNQKTADLPPERLERSPPFTNTGVDVFGHYFIRVGNTTRKNSATKKVWVLLCTCLVSRAVHLEILSSLDTPTLRLAFRRFFALRGSCRRLVSDHGTNFIGAKNEMLDNLDIDSLRSSVQDHGCVWDFIPPAASHFAGVWERKVGTVKKALSAAMFQLGTRSISYDEFATLVQEAASIVNDTPLYEVSCDPNDPFPITPNNLLTLRDEGISAPVNSFSKDDLLAYGKARWRRVQYLVEQFWKNWREGYLTSLQNRNKWAVPSPNIKINDIVLIKDKSTQRSKWPMGRDNLVRSVTLSLKPNTKGTQRTMERSIHDLVLLIPSERK